MSSEGPLYTVTERFGPHCGTAWTGYVAWSKLGQLRELVDPESLPTPPADEHGFRFEGCDSIDVWSGPSASTNCGGFPSAFDDRELNDRGLLPSLERARQVQQALRQHDPDEDHAKCDVWCVFRATSSP